MRRTGDDLEDRLYAKAYAVLFRSIATPNFELHRFASLARGVSPHAFSN